jgi:Grass antifreeze beta roll
MENVHHRIDALAQQLQRLEAHTQTVERRLRGWRRLAWSLVVLSLVSLGQSASTAQEECPAAGRLGARLAEFEHALGRLRETLKHVALRADDAGRPEGVFSGVNVRIVNGLGSTDCLDEQFQPIPDCPHGRGNLIVGYNEPRNEDLWGPNIRTGSHNVVVGEQHNCSCFGGLVVGLRNTISGDYAAVSGGRDNTASGSAAAVSGGEENTAAGRSSAVSGGEHNEARGQLSTVSGGENNLASGRESSVSGGQGNEAEGSHAAVSGRRNVLQAVKEGWAAGSVGDAIAGRFRSP